jgi:hypothetical protein
MKVTVNVECTPEEARAFMGLPDVAPMQEALMKDLENRMRSNMDAMSPENMFKTWLPGMQGAEQIQKMFWSQIQQSVSSATNVASDAMTNVMNSGGKKK